MKKLIQLFVTLILISICVGTGALLHAVYIEINTPPIQKPVEPVTPKKDTLNMSFNEWWFGKRNSPEHRRQLEDTSIVDVNGNPITQN